MLRYRKRAREAQARAFEAQRRAQHYYNAAEQEEKYAKYHVTTGTPSGVNSSVGGVGVGVVNLYAARNMEMRPLPPVPVSPDPAPPKSPDPSDNSGEYNSPNQNLSADGVFGAPSPHSGDFCTMPLPGRSGAYPQLRPQRKASGDILEYPEETSPHYFELDPEGLPLPPPPENLLPAGVDVAPVHGTGMMMTSPGNNNNNMRKTIPNGGIPLPGMPHPKTPEEENHENFGRESMTSQTDSMTSQHEPQFEYTGAPGCYPENYRETGKFSWP